MPQPSALAVVPQMARHAEWDVSHWVRREDGLPAINDFRTQVLERYVADQRPLFARPSTMEAVVFAGRAPLVSDAVVRSPVTDSVTLPGEENRGVVVPLPSHVVHLGLAEPKDIPDLHEMSLSGV
jgi:hypothetical protein